MKPSNDLNKENEILLTTLIESLFYNSGHNSNNLELIFSANCNQNCSYCYLQNNRAELYPMCIDKEENILENLQILVDHYVDSGVSFEEVSIFSGEFFALSYCFKALDILLDSVNRRKWFNYIDIPSNFSFVKDSELVAKIDSYRAKFTEAGVLNFLSCSIDGALVDETDRSGLVEVKDYDAIFKYIESHKSDGFHPMLSANVIEKWKDNLDWWIKKLNQYNIKRFPMLLEVRNDFWTPEKIELYQDFLKYYAEKKLKDFHKGDLKDFYVSLLEPHTYDILRFNIARVGLSCSLQNRLIVRLGDLSIVPCHRLMYSKFIIGKFNVSDKKIAGITPMNVNLAIKLWSMNPIVSHIKCSSCDIKYLCTKGCLGSQYEATKELLYPIDSVCDLYKAKWHTLHEIYTEYGVYDYAQTIKNERTKKHCLFIKELLCKKVQ